MKEVSETVIISGKGGTGKTSLTASLIPFLNRTVVADCDVDAPNLSILLEPRNTGEELFFGTRKAVRDELLCESCGECRVYCLFGAIDEDLSIKPPACEGCGVCVHVCPAGALKLEKAAVGTIYESETDYAPMVHARLIPGEETSGRLVSEVRGRANQKARDLGYDHVLIDGPPGIGCAVISACTGADRVCIVTEPTVSGLHDLERLYTMLQRFEPEISIIINKSDLSQKGAAAIEEFADLNGIPVILHIPFRKEIVISLSEKRIPSIAEAEFFEDLGWQGAVDRLSPVKAH